jgi:hypothetical protein
MDNKLINYDPSPKCRQLQWPPLVRASCPVHLFWDFSHQFYLILLINDLFFTYYHSFYSGWQKNKYYLFYFINKWFIPRLFPYLYSGHSENKWFLLFIASTVRCPLSAVHCPLSSVHCPLSTVHRLLSIIYCQYNTCLDHFPLLCALIINKDLSICFIPSWQIINAIYFILLINDLIFIYSHLFYTDQPRNKLILFYFINKWFIAKLSPSSS